ncbi:MAG: hypothetical protein HUU15_12655 [Candidatus Brocadiae bacterium]|nr:hypothetical protein [Candidatus Brocadiia bacterium]
MDKSVDLAKAKAAMVRLRAEISGSSCWESISQEAIRWAASGEGFEALRQMKKPESPEYTSALKLTGLDYRRAAAMSDEDFARTFVIELARKFMKSCETWNLVSVETESASSRLTLSGPRGGRTILDCDTVEDDWRLGLPTARRLLHWWRCEWVLERLAMTIYKFDAEEQEWPGSLGEVPELAASRHAACCPHTNEPYAYLYPVCGDTTPIQQVVVYDAPSKPGDGHVVLTFGGDIAVVDEVEFKKWLSHDLEVVKTSLEGEIKSAEQPGGSIRKLKALRELRDKLRGEK